jgi:platelet-activating factor acetylhydrolase
MQTISRRSPWGALLSRTLPEYKGPHAVGVFDMEIPVNTPRNVGSFRYRDIPLHEGGFKVLLACAAPALLVLARSC